MSLDLGRWLVLLPLALTGCGPGDGSSPPSDGGVRDASRRDGALPLGPGWIELQNTRFRDICPDDPALSPASGNTCGAVTAAWGGGIADTDEDLLLIWGGGHNDYWGNEVYALDVRAGDVFLLTEPSPPTSNPDSCSVTTLADGAPNSRHTYDNLAFIPGRRAMFAFGGAVACRPGGGAEDTWLLDIASADWSAKDPTAGTAPDGYFVASTDYDPVTGLVVMHDTSDLYTYDAETNTYTHRAEGSQDYHLVGRVDPDKREFVMLGGGEAWAYDLETWQRRALSLPCDAIVDAPYPGLTWDSVAHELVAWAGGSSLYVIDVDAGTCEEEAHEGDPGPALENGTNGRFRFFPALDVFALVNRMDENAFVVRRRAE
jgi:hypothetical protein